MSKTATEYLRELTVAVDDFLREMDAVMLLPPTAVKGRRIATLVNNLNLANERARYFGLGEDFWKGSSKVIK